MTDPVAQRKIPRFSRLTICVLKKAEVSRGFWSNFQRFLNWSIWQQCSWEREPSANSDRVGRQRPARRPGGGQTSRGRRRMPLPPGCRGDDILRFFDLESVHWGSIFQTILSIFAMYLLFRSLKKNYQDQITFSCPAPLGTGRWLSATRAAGPPVAS